MLLLGILGFPFIKVATLVPGERFRKRDIHLLYWSAAALLVLFTCSSVAYDGYAQWRASADAGVEALAQDLERRFIREITSIRDELEDYDGLVATAAPRCAQVHTRWFQRSDERPVRWPIRQVQLKQVAWIGSDGRQIWKSTADTIQGKTLVDQRAYFRAVREESLFDAGVSGPPFFFGPGRSISDGKSYTFVAIASKSAGGICPDNAKDGGTRVVATTAHLLSLTGSLSPLVTVSYSSIVKAASCTTRILGCRSARTSLTN